MNILVVSDSHGSKEELADLSRMYAGKMDVMIHCGDSELRADDEVLDHFKVVRGNCDMDQRFPETHLEEGDGRRILVTHGHLYGIKMSLMKLKYKAEELGADMVFFGHSHELGAELMDGILFLNPGSILLPRGRHEKTYALIESTKHKIHVKFLTEKHELVQEIEFDM
ncbi:metallophosphoesterase [Rossellomorea marisflavi]|uniref:metallophosphoesterase n=1 Tax=Rossellomorea marisflavi TaxID=189381 RepID=UPI00064E5850|nr:metallophosphoesterase [Rossellomorea marisflavi]KML07346.1 metallophosphatase [Rossellomorea marisflavi]